MKAETWPDWKKGDRAIVNQGDRDRDVRVMATSSFYAMVRVRGMYPFVVPIKELRPPAEDGR